MKKYMMFVDAESDGLYGAFISVAMVITNQVGEILREEYFGIKRDDLVIREEWVKQNVLPVLGEYREVNTQEELLEEVWNIWSEYMEDAYVVADVSFPVESRLFYECVKLNQEERGMKGPFPLLDLSSMLYAKGVDPLSTREGLIESEGKSQLHNALYDTKLSREIWKRYIITDR